MNTFWMVLEPAIGVATGQRFAIRQREPVSGGCIHQPWRVDDGDRTYFVKVNDAARLPLFEAEAAGLAALAAMATVRAPAPLSPGVVTGHAYLVLPCCTAISGVATPAVRGTARRWCSIRRSITATGKLIWP